MTWLDFPYSYFLLPLSPVPVIASLFLFLLLYSDLCIQLFHFFLSIVTFFLIFRPSFFFFLSSRSFSFHCLPFL